MWWSQQRRRLLKLWPHHRNRRREAVFPTPLSPASQFQSINISLTRSFWSSSSGIAMDNGGGVLLNGGGRIIHLVNGQANTMTESCDQRYQAAVCQLNKLQSNSLTLATHQGREKQRFQSTFQYLKRSGISLEQLDQLPIIHVAGTKGKGSVCSFVESILRQHGLKTGFFSSPHLVSVTERIRLNGVPMSESSFADQFWRLYHQLDAAKENNQDMPPYFKFLTLMAFNVFLAEKVDVAIMEVGIGGLYDCTNIVRNTRTVGITSLGLDHVTVLGDTVEKIARQKAGIIKRHSHVFTVKQPGKANEVIEAVAADREAKLSIVPNYDEYSWIRQPQLNLTTTSVHKLNISLAIQLSMDWLVHLGRLPSNVDRTYITEEIVSGIEKFSWPGRYQVIARGSHRLYLDGAHTLESVEACLQWFQGENKAEKSFKCLLFFVTGTRDVESLARPILDKGGFDLIIICPNVVDSQATIMDNVTANVDSNDLAIKCKEIQKTFQRIGKDSVPVEVKSSVSDALRLVDGVGGEVRKDILITGSLYLVGTALIALNKKVEVSDDVSL